MSDNARTILVVVAGLVGVFVLFLCLVVAGAILFLGISGPAVGNVFSNIVVNLPTPTP